MTDGPGRVETLGTYVHAVHDAAAAEHAERVVHRGQTLFGDGLAAVGQEAVGLQLRSGPEELVRVQPADRAPDPAESAQDGLIPTVQTLTIFRRLQTLNGTGRRDG